MTRRNDFVDCERHKSRSAAVYEIGPTRTMPQIIIGLRIGEEGGKGWMQGGEPTFNRPYNCVLIIEGQRFTWTHVYMRIYAYMYAHVYAKAGAPTAVRPQRARMHIFLATVRSINSAILRALLDLTSRFSIVWCAVWCTFEHHEYKKKRKKRKERICPPESAPTVLSQPILCCRRYWRSFLVP